MWISNVNLPDQLVSAQRDGRLAIFAGAGVSMGPPSNLPSFTSLAREVAGVGIELEPDEPLDRFLGRVQGRGTDIQVRARDILDNPHSQVRGIHRALCQLFRSQSDVRLITTNFDRHFTTALRDEYGETVPIYHAPALPLGHNFGGLVYLHGAVEHPSHPLVLSDADFGRAYLTEGWATRFLYEVFRTYTVLFVGYSHRDPVVRYIARSLPPGGVSRFALVSTEDDGQWQYFGVTAISYPLQEPPEKHATLDTVICHWVNRCRMGVFDHEHQIRELVRLPPPVEKHDVDYLETICRDAATLRFFVDAAQDREWVEWIAQKGFLKSLFAPDVQLDECSRLFARWLTQYALRLPQPLFDLIREAGGRINFEFWFDLTRTIAFANPRPNVSLLAQWVVVLVQAASPQWPHHCLDEVLKGCSGPEHGGVALLLWRHLATPHGKLVRPWFTEEDEDARIRVELYTIGELHDLQQCLQKYFLRHLDTLHAQLAPMLTSMLHEAHMLMRGSGEGNDHWDGTSRMRSAIEPHEQDRHLHDLDVLVDAARDLIEWLLANRRDCGVGLRSQWLESSTPLVLRLGIHALAIDNQAEPDKAIELIVSRGWLYGFGVKHEAFQLLKAKYHLASEAVRQRTLAASLADPPSADPPSEEGQATREISPYERFNLALWLYENASNCSFTAAHFNKLKEENPDFGRREYPDLNSWGTEAGWVTPRSPLTVDEVLAQTPAEAGPSLAAYQGKQDAFDGPTRRGLLTVVREAASRDCSWTVRIMEALRHKEIWKGDLWEALLDGLAAAKHSREEWENIVGLLDSVPQVARESHRSLLDLLEKLVEEETAIVTTELVLCAMKIGRGTLGEEEHEDTVFSADHKDWLTRAINHVGGKTAMITVQGLGKLRQFAGDSWERIPEEEKEWLEAMCRDHRIDAQRARIVLASQFHFFFDLDREWTTRVILPLFDWENDEVTAEQVWYGYLTWGKWNDAILEALRPSFEASFARISTNLSELRDDFSTRLAGIALYAAFDPWHDGWLIKFVRDADNLGLQSWAWAMGRALQELTPEAVTTTWTGWMKDYWEARVTGVPRPFVKEELGAMLDWISGLLPVLPEAVELLCRQAVYLPEHSTFLYELRESPALVSYPLPIGRLFAHLLKHANGLGYECGFAAEITRKLHAAGAEHGVLRDAIESLGRLRCTEATQLRTDLLV